MNRRDFIKGTGLFYLSIPFLKASQDLGRVVFSGDNNTQFASENATVFLELETFKFKKIVSPLNCHSFIQNPVRKNQIVGVEKWRTGMGVFDSDTYRLIKILKSDYSEQFVGHGEFSADGSLLYVSSAQYSQPGSPSLGKGFIYVYETKRFSLIEKFHSFGFEPHQICLFDDDRYLLVLNPGFTPSSMNRYPENLGPLKGFCPSITIIETKSKSLFKEIPLPDPEISLAHLTKIGKEEFFFVGGKRLIDNNWENQAFYFSLEKGFRSFKTTGKGLNIPLLSTAYSSKNNAFAATSPVSNELLLWKNDHLIKLGMINPQGVTLSKDGKNFVVIQNDFISLVEISSQKILKQKRLQIQNFGGHSLTI